MFPFQGHAREGDGISPKTANELGQIGGGGDPGANSGSGAGGVSSDVNLYTGDATARIALAALAGRAGLGASIDLAYSSNVKNEVRLPNYIKQTSWVGLGWQSGFPKIVSDHKSTVDIDDDEYYLIDGTGVSTKLIKVFNDYDPYFLTEKGHTFARIKRQIVTLPPDSSGTGVYIRRHIIGWTITGIDGITQCFGDFTDTSQRNATWYTASYNNAITTGTSPHRPYPWAWGLAKVKYEGLPDSSYVVYERDEPVLPGGWYTRGLHPRYVWAADGAHIEIFTGPRYSTEFGARFPDLIAPVLDTRYLSELRVFNPDSVLLSKVSLTYGAVGTGYRYKRLLTGLTFENGVGDTSEHVEFQYVQSTSADSNFGAISSVVSLTGQETRFHYERKELSYAAKQYNATYRLQQHEDKECLWNFTQWQYSNDVSSNVTYSSDLLGLMSWSRGDADEYLHLMQWNGRWQDEIVYHGTTDDSLQYSNRYYRGRDCPLAAGPGTLAYWDAASDNLMVGEAKESVWEFDSVFHWDDVYHHDSIGIQAGDGYFLVFSFRGAGTASDVGRFYVVWRTRFYEDEWLSQLVFDSVKDAGHESWGRVETSPSFLHVYDRDENPDGMQMKRLGGELYGWYDPNDCGPWLNDVANSTKHMTIMTQQPNFCYCPLGVSKCVRVLHHDIRSADDEVLFNSVDQGLKSQLYAGQDYVAFWRRKVDTAGDELCLVRWNGDSLVTSHFYWLGATWHKLIIPGPDYVCVLFASDEDQFGYNRLQIFYTSGAGWASTSLTSIPLLMVEANNNEPLPNATAAGGVATSEAIFLWGPQTRQVYGIMRGVGNSFSELDTLCDLGHSASMPLFEGAAGRHAVFTVTGPDTSSTRLIGYSHDWEQWDTLTLMIDDGQTWLKPVAGLPGCNGLDRCCDPFLSNSWAYEKEWLTFVTDEYVAVLFEDSSNAPLPAGGTHLNDSLQGRLHLFRWDDDSLAGNFQTYVVAAKRSTFAGNQKETVTRYDYFDGVTDESGGFARFGRARVSMPGDSTWSFGYTEHCFYNDLDNEDDTLNAQLPDLDTLSGEYNRYEYLLDGLTYKTRSVNGQGYGLDSTVTVYDVTKPSIYDTVFENAYLTLPVRQYTYSFGLVDSTRTTYNLQNGLPAVVYRFAQDGSILATRTEYAFQTDATWDDSLKARNLLSIPSSVTTFRAATDTSTTGGTGRDTLKWSRTVGTFDTLLGRYLPSIQESLRDTATHAVLRTLDAGWDSVNVHNQLVQSRDPYGLRSATRYDAASRRPVISGRNARVSELRYYDMESDFRSVDPDFKGQGTWTDGRPLSGGGSFVQGSHPDSTRWPVYIWVPAPLNNGLQQDSVYEVTTWVWCTKPGSVRFSIYEKVDTGWIYRNYSDSNATSGRWEMLRDTVKFRWWADNHQVELLECAVRLDASSPPCSVWVDDLRFQPLRSEAVTTAYEPARGLVVAEAGPDCVPIRYLYDEFGKRIETIDASGRALSTQWTRLSSRRHDGVYDAADPNQSGSITSREGNMARNGSFEAGPLCWNRPAADLTNWGNTWWESIVSSIVHDSSYLGARSFRIDSSQALLVQREPANVEPDSVYRIRFYGMSDDGLGSFFYLLRFYDSTGQERGAANDTLPGGWQFDSGLRAYRWPAGGIILQTSWTPYEIGFKAPATTWANYRAKAVRLGLYVNGGSTTNGDQSRIDDILVTTDRGSGDVYTGVAIRYIDPLGRELQTRTKYVVPDSNLERSTVSFGEYDSQGRVHKSYKPYEDKWNATSVRSYEPEAALVSEANQYYNGSHGPDCGGFPYGQAAFLNDPRSLIVERAYAGSDWSLSSGHTDTVAHDRVDDQFRITTRNADGVFSEAYKDRWGRMVKTRSVVAGSQALDSTEYAYDLLGNLLQTTDPRRFISKAYYNALGQKTRDSVPDYLNNRSTQYVYDKAGRLRFRRDPRDSVGGYFVYFKYDLLGRKIEEGRVSMTLARFSQDSADVRTYPSMLYPTRTVLRTSSYDAFDGSILSALVPGNRGQLQRMTAKGSPPDTTTTNYREYDYDARGLVTESRIWIKGFGTSKKLNYTYDAVGQLVRTKYPDGVTLVQTDVNPANGVTTLTEVDTGTRLARSRINPDGTLQLLELGDRKDSTSVHPVATLPYKYNSIGWVTQIGDTALDPSYFAHYVYYSQSDTAACPARFTGLVVSVDTYWDDAAGGAFDSASFDYAYDQRGWITLSRANGVLFQDTLEQWWYDANGNIDTVLGRNYNYNYPLNLNSNLLSTITTSGSFVHDYFYDAVGNVTTRDFYLGDGYLMHRYDDRNLVTLVTEHKEVGYADSLYLTYDADGRRVKRELVWRETCGGTQGPEGGFEGGVVDTLMFEGSIDEEGAGTDGIGPPPPPPPQTCRYSSAVWYIWEGNKVVAEFRYNDSTLYGLHYYLGDMQVAGRSGDGNGPQKQTLVYWFNDHLGQPRYQCDSTGRWIAATAFSPFGRVLMDYRSEYPGIPRGFGNKNTDPQPSGKMDFLARQYDPEIGRFLSVDAAGQFATPYSYTGNIPTVFVDRDGNIALIDDLIIGISSFVASYYLNGITTGNWGWDNLKQAFVSGVASVAAYNTGGLAAGGLGKAFGFKAGSAAFAITSSTIGGAAGGLYNGIGSQLVSGNPIDWNLVGKSVIGGSAGGLAGGAWGRWVATDPVSPGLVGGAAGGAASGGNVFQGAVLGYLSSAISEPLMQRGYEFWADRWTNELYPGHGLEANLGEYEEVSCHDFANCLTYSETGDGKTLSWTAFAGRYVGEKPLMSENGSVLFAPGDPVLETAHSGIALGRTRYGQYMVLSKLNVNEPVTVRTGVWLNRHYNLGFGNAYYEYGPTGRR